MPPAPGYTISQSEWITILTWREEHPYRTEAEVIHHFARPENGSIQFSIGALRRRWKQWKELRKACGEGQQPAFKINRHRALKDSEWVEVFTFVDEHPDCTRVGVVKHFGSLGLQFHRRTLAQKLGEREAIELRVGGVGKSKGIGKSKGKGKAKLPTGRSAVGRRK